MFTLECKITPYSVGKVAVNCPYGTFGKLNSVGVIPSFHANKNLCMAIDDGAEITTKCPLRSDIAGKFTSQMKNDQQENKFEFSFLSDIFDTTKDINPACHDEDAKIFVNYFCY